MNIFDFIDYRKWLKYRIQEGKRGEITRLAELLRVHPTFISQVLSQLRELNPDQALELCEHWGLAHLETDYFTTLIEIERAQTEKLKKRLREKREKLKRESLDLSKRVSADKVLSEEDKSIFYSSWLYSAIRAAVSIKDGKTIDEICEFFDLSRPKVIELLQFLCRTGLCIQEKEKYRAGTQRTHLEKQSPHMAKHHLNWRLKAMTKVENLSERELMFSAPLSISRSDFEVVREKIVKLIKETSDTVAATTPEEIACLNIDFINLAD